MPAAIAAPAPSTVIISDGGLRAWLTVLGSTAAVTASFGVINSIGTFQSYLASHQLRTFTERDVGWIPAVNIFLCLFLGVQFGPLFDHYGPRLIMASASVVYFAGMLGMSFLDCGDQSPPLSASSSAASTPVPWYLDTGDPTNGGCTAAGRTYALLMLTWGVLCGAAAAALQTTSLAVTAHWFDRRRGLAAGIVYAGSSAGGVAFPLLMRETLPTLGWGWSVRIVAFIVMGLLAVANVCIRGRHRELRSIAATNGTLWKDGKTSVLDLSCFRDMRFLWLTLGIAMFEFVVSAAVGMLPSWAKSSGFDQENAFAFLAVYNAGSLVGRIVAGIVSDRLGALNTVMGVLVMSISIIYGLWIPVTTERLPLFYIFAVTFGTTTGSIMSMAPAHISTPVFTRAS
ncbi:hypothetical protein DL771_002637 [Monosporascus sp. 5C6A]|nr:hypothetical protein DL771_002637 [Monosporascus sp. 5C6A]